MPASNEIYARVERVLVEALRVAVDVIKSAATLKGDLGAESIEFLEIMFGLEREFVIRIQRGELFAEPVLLTDTDIVRDGLLARAARGLRAPPGFGYT